MQGPRGPGSLKAMRRREPHPPRPAEIPRPGSGPERTVADAAGVEPSVSAPPCAGPIVRYTIDYTVNGYQGSDLRSWISARSRRS